jgi:hypothetical protein
MERVLFALVVAAICAVLYYVQLYWVSIMQCLLAFVLFHYCDASAFQFSEQRRAVLIRLLNPSGPMRARRLPITIEYYTLHHTLNVRTKAICTSRRECCDYG